MHFNFASAGTNAPSAGIFAGPFILSPVQLMAGQSYTFPPTTPHGGLGPSAVHSARPSSTWGSPPGPTAGAGAGASMQQLLNSGHPTNAVSSPTWQQQQPLHGRQPTSSFGIGSSPGPSRIPLPAPTGVRPSPPRAPLPNHEPSYRQPSSSPPLPLYPLMDTISPMFIDAIANDFGFGEADRDLREYLHGFITMGAGLSKPDLATRVFLLASQFQIMKSQRAAVQNTQHIQGMFQDLYTRLEDKFTLTADQELTLRIVIQDHFFSYKCISFNHAYIDIEKIIKREKEAYNLHFLFQNPNRERVLCTAVKKQCRISRNTMREMLRDSVIGKATVPLDECCWTLATRFKRGGAGAGISNVETARIAILRRFIYEHPHLVSLQVEPEDPVDPNQELTGDSRPSTPTTPLPTGRDSPMPGPPPTKKRKTGIDGKIGRPQKGQEFWAAVDTWFKTQMTNWGLQWNATPWEDYIAETLAWDRKEFPAEVQLPIAMASAPVLPSTSFLSQPIQASGPFSGQSGSSSRIAGILATM